MANSARTWRAVALTTTLVTALALATVVLGIYGAAAVAVILTVWQVWPRQRRRPAFS